MSIEVNDAFSPLLSTDLEELLSLGYLRGFAEGDTLYAPGESVGRVYLVSQGRLAVATPDGTVRTTVGPGQVFGAESLRASFICGSRVYAETDCTAISLSRQEANWLVDNEPSLAARLFWRLTAALATSRTEPERVLARTGGELEIAPRSPLLSQLVETVRETREAINAAGEPPASEAAEWAGERLPAVSAALTKLITGAEGVLRASPVEDREAMATTIRRELAPLTSGSALAQRFAERSGGKSPGFRVFNLVYREQPEGRDTAGLLWDAYSLRQKFASGLRERRHIMAERITGEVAERAQGRRRVRVLTLGCGPAHSLAHLLEQPGLSDRVSLVCVDDDQEAIVYANNLLTQLAPRGDITFKQSRPADVDPEAAGFGGYDVVASQYVTDSVQPAELAEVLVTAYQWLNPGGALLLSALSDQDPDQFLVETIFTWQPTHYEQRVLADLLTRSPFPSDETTIETSDSGLNLFLRAVKK